MCGWEGCLPVVDDAEPGGVGEIEGAGDVPTRRPFIFCCKRSDGEVALVGEGRVVGEESGGDNCAGESLG